MIALHCEPYHVAFRAAARDAGSSYAERRGALLVVSGPSGSRGSGELGPLPGRSQDTLEVAQKALENLLPAQLPTEAELRGEHWFSALERASALLPRGLPAAQHALETALLDLCGALRGEPCPALLAQALGRALPAAPLPLAALIDASELSVACERAQAALEQGIRTLKLKIAGSESDDAIVSRVCTVASLSDSLRLRLDANRSLSPERTLLLSPRLAACHGVEFLEEPVAFSELAALPPLGLTLAVDESLLDADFALGQARGRGVGVVVLKPMLLGFLASLRLARAATDAGLEVVLSHTFDGPSAMAAARSLALALGPRRFADGLAAHAALDTWPAPIPAHVSAPWLTSWSAPGLGLP